MFRGTFLLHKIKKSRHMLGARLGSLLFRNSRYLDLERYLQDHHDDKRQVPYTDYSNNFTWSKTEKEERESEGSA